MIQIQSFTFNSFEENTYVLFDETGESVIIDPGCYEKEEKYELKNFISTNKLNVTLLLNTHCHIDHVLGNDYVKEKYKAPLLIHPIEETVLKAVITYASIYGFPHYREAVPDQYLKEGEFIVIGNSKWKVLFLPGHSPGHVGFYNKDINALISGDVLFKNSIGRTQFNCTYPGYGEEIFW